MNKKNILLAGLVSVLACSPAFARPVAVGADADASEPLVSYWSSDPGITEMPVSEGASETYAETDRKWQGLPTIAVTPAGGCGAHGRRAIPWRVRKDRIITT